MERTYTKIEEHLDSLLRLVGNVKDIGHATLYSNREVPSTEFNHVSRVNVAESEAKKLIADVARYFTSMEVNPCFIVSPTTQPKTLANLLLQASFELVLEEDIMIYRGGNKSSKTSSDTEVALIDRSQLDVWTDVFMKSFEIPEILRGAFLAMCGKAVQHKGTRPYLAYFSENPAGTCALLSFRNVGGVFNLGTTPEYRRKGVATALMQNAISDSLNMGNNLLYLVTTKGSNAESLYTSLGFRVAYTRRRYELQRQKQQRA
jgi:GNAT superfamily N-acetyltransferase